MRRVGYAAAEEVFAKNRMTLRQYAMHKRCSECSLVVCEVPCAVVERMKESAQCDACKSSAGGSCPNPSCRYSTARLKVAA
jgi:hypothetical protein